MKGTECSGTLPYNCKFPSHARAIGATRSICVGAHKQEQSESFWSAVAMSTFVRIMAADWEHREESRRIEP